MMQLVQENWVLLAIALAIGIVLAWWLFAASRKTVIARDAADADTGPVRRNQALIDSAPAATTASTTAVPPSVPEPALAKAPRAGDDLTRIKGLGPRISALLAEQGITTFAQIAQWDDAAIAAVDARLGQFQGRIRRDGWVEQARLLAAGDTAGYEAKFGRL